MDEIDFLKKVFKIITISFIGITCFMLFGIIRANADEKIVLITLVICGGMYAFTFLIYYLLKIKFTNQFSIKYINNKDLHRDIINKYPPAIYSFLYNKKIESYTDYTATILSLECKKYLKVNDDGYDITVLNNDVEGLLEHEKYVMNCIMRNDKFKMADFNKIIILDLLQLDLICIKENKKISFLDNKYVQVLLPVLSVLVLIFLVVTHLDIMTSIFFYGFILGAITYLGFIIFSMSSIIINDGDNTKYNLTKKGKDVRKNIFGLKRFLREYTLINEREIEYKELFENYIAFALSLGEAKTIEKFVSNNKKYRNLIYKKEGEQI